jgi:hypothetical protein
MGLNLVRLTYWLGALVDALAGVQLLLPTSVTFLGFTGLRAPGAAGYPAVTAAVLMFGFSAILVWAHLRTVDRRRVLLFTLLVVIALALSNVVFCASGVLPWSELIPPLLIQSVLIALFAISYSITVREAGRRAALTSAST